MPRYSPTNEEILRRLRFSEVYHHRRCREYFFGLGLLTLPVSLPIPQVYLEHIQDSYNKSTAIYSIAPHLEGHTEAYVRDGVNRRAMIFSIYEQWFCDNHVDVDFGNFVAKLIRVEIASVDQWPKAEDIIKIHKAWCEHLEFHLPLCSRRTDPAGREIEDPSFEFHGNIGINKKQNMYYKLTPLFRALVMVLDDYTSSDADPVVHLFRTNIPSRMSAPITFENLSPRLESDKFMGYRNDDLITTTLTAAISFVTALEMREELAFPEDRRDTSVIDERGAEQGYHTIQARSMGYTGPDIQKTSSTWANFAEGEDVLAPLTPAVMHRPEMKNTAIFTRYAHQIEQRK